MTNLAREISSARIFYLLNGLQAPNFTVHQRQLPAQKMGFPIVAAVKGELDLASSLTKTLAEYTGRRIWKKYYDLDVSDVAFQEHFAVSQHRLYTETEIADLFQGTDSVVLFQSTYSLLPQREREATLVHELWHLLEKQEGVFSIAPMIFEGTARYAENCYLGDQETLPPEECPNFMAFLYRGAAYVVKDHMQSRPLVQLLDPSLRHDIEGDLMERSSRRMVDWMGGLYEEFIADKDLCNKFKNTRFMQAFASRLTPQGIVQAYRELGCPTMAAELEGQDLARLISYYRRILE